MNSTHLFFAGTTAKQWGDGAIWVANIKIGRFQYVLVKSAKPVDMLMYNCSFGKFIMPPFDAPHDINIKPDQRADKTLDWSKVIPPIQYFGKIFFIFCLFFLCRILSIWKNVSLIWSIFLRKCRKKNEQLGSPLPVMETRLNSKSTSRWGRSQRTRPKHHCFPLEDAKHWRFFKFNAFF